MKSITIQFLLLAFTFQSAIFAQESNKTDTPKYAQNEGLFGITLTEVLDIDREDLTELSVSEYTLDLKKIDTEMDVCFIYITPISKRIHSIIASREFNTKEEALKAQDQLMKSLAIKYGPEAPLDDSYKIQRARKVLQEKRMAGTQVDLTYAGDKVDKAYLRFTITDLELQQYNFQETERFMIESFNDPDF